MLFARYASLGSTNDTAAAWALRQPGRWLGVAADAQHTGRGRQSRAWSSPRGGIWLSLVAPLTTPPADRGPLPLVVGLAVRDTIEAIAREHGHRELVAEVKWPNDVLIRPHAFESDHGKASGVLCEQVFVHGTTGRPSAIPAVLGVGVNANLDAEDLGPNLRVPPATLREALGVDVPLPATTRRLAEAIAAAVDRWDRDGLTVGDVDRLNAALAFRGETVRLTRSLGLQPGFPENAITVERVDAAGRLCGIDPRGRALAIDTGELTGLFEPRRRPAAVLTPA